MVRISTQISNVHVYINNGMINKAVGKCLIISNPTLFLRPLKELAIIVNS